MANQRPDLDDSRIAHNHEQLDPCDSTPEPEEGRVRGQDIHSNESETPETTDEAVKGGGQGVSEPAPPQDLSDLADPGCSRCYGTGRLGYYRNARGERKPVPCRCVQKAMFKLAVKREREKHGGITLEAPDDHNSD